MESIALQLSGLILVLGGIVAFAVRKWVTASIDARFKATVEAELARVRHTLSIDAETIKAELAKDLENHKRKIGESGRLEAYVTDKNIQLYEVFHDKFGELMIKLNAFKELSGSLYANPEFAHRHMVTLLDLAQEARVATDKFSMYTGAGVTMRLATLYHDIVNCLGDLPINADEVHRLTDLYGELSVTLDPTRGLTSNSL